MTRSKPDASPIPHRRTAAHPRRQFLVASAGLLTSWPLASRAQMPGGPAASALAALRQGGVTLYFRHGATATGGVDRIEWPRARQRLLSDAGEAQARAVGAAFQRHALRAGEVRASPFARCREFAEIAFGRVQDDRELLGLLSQDAERQARIDHSLRLLRRAVPAGQVQVLVGHSSNIAQTTEVNLPEGGAVLVRPSAAAPRGFDVLATLQPADWAALAA